MVFIFTAKVPTFSLEKGFRCESICAVRASERSPPVVVELCASRTCMVGIGRRSDFGCRVVISFFRKRLFAFCRRYGARRITFQRKCFSPRKKRVAPA